jgi:O-antigen ligase
MVARAKIQKRFFDFLRLKIEQESVSYFFAGFCMIIIPIYTWYAPPLIALWTLARIFEIYFNKKNGRNVGINKENLTLAILFITFFLLEVFSLIYSENITNGTKIVFSRLILLIFPLLFISPGRLIQNNESSLLKLFAKGTVIYIAYCFVFAFVRSVSYEEGQLIINTHPPEGYWLSYFFGSYFSVNQHPSYAAIFVIISILITFESIINNRLRRDIRILWSLSALLLIISLYFLSSRAAFIITLIVIPFYIFLKLHAVNKSIIAVVLIIFILIGGFLIIRTNERIKYYLEQLSHGSVKDKTGKEDRILIWKSSLKIVSNNLLFGVGVGDVRDELIEEYESSGDKDLFENRYNAHNQFLEITMEGGMISLVFFLLIIGYMTFRAIKTRNHLFTLFIIIMVIFFMFETVLYRLAGIILFSCFSFLLIQDDSLKRID